MKKLAILIVFVFLVSCTSAPSQTVVVTKEIIVTQEVEVTRIQEVVQTVEVPVEVTRLVEVTQLVEVTPAPPPLPDVFLELEGNGDIITENFEWGPCQKAIWFWEALGRGNIIVGLYRVGDGRQSYIINEIGPLTGQALEGLDGGTYYLEIVGPSEGWTIRGECQD